MIKEEYICWACGEEEVLNDIGMCDRCYDRLMEEEKDDKRSKI